MITRIVKMTFEEKHLSTFLIIFNESKHKIRASKGCESLKLLQDTKNKNV